MGKEIDTNMTNADKIRNMTDEELAELLLVNAYEHGAEYDYVGHFLGYTNNKEDAIRKELEWLKSEESYAAED